MTRWRWVLIQGGRQLWVRATLIGGLGILAAVIAGPAERYIPWTLPGSIGANAVDGLLTIIASSMLAVTTFSLSIMVSAYGSATSNVTPRATRLLIEDQLAQTVLSTFIGSFLFGVVGLIVLKIGAYGERGRVILFVITIIVIALVVASLLRWIDHLTRLGRVGETTNRVEDAVKNAILARLHDPCLGGKRLNTSQRAVPANAIAIMTPAIGYVQHVDTPALSQLCETNGIDFYMNAIPGTFVYPHTPLGWISTTSKEIDIRALAQKFDTAFLIGDERVFDQDPRFGLAVMSEIGSRALSPATNDPGTAIDVIGRTTRLLSIWAQGHDQALQKEPRYPRLHVPPLQAQDLFEDGFMLIARDGAGLIEVQLRIQKSLAALSQIGDDAFRAAAHQQSRMALARAQSAMTLKDDRQRLTTLLRHRRHHKTTHIVSLH